MLCNLRVGRGVVRTVKEQVQAIKPRQFNFANPQQTEALRQKYIAAGLIKTVATAK